MQKGIDYPAIAVGFLCHDGKGNFLFQKRGKNCRDEQGTWDFGGGGLDLGMSVEETMLKEVKEEYCIKPISYEFLGYEDVFIELNNTKTHWICLDFLVLVKPDEVKNGEPHKFDEIGWFKLNALPSPLHSTIPGILNKFKNKLLS